MIGVTGGTKCGCGLSKQSSSQPKGRPICSFINSFGLRTGLVLLLLSIDMDIRATFEDYELDLFLWVRWGHLMRVWKAGKGKPPWVYKSLPGLFNVYWSRCHCWVTSTIINRKQFLFVGFIGETRPIKLSKTFAWLLGRRCRLYSYDIPYKKIIFL